MKSRNTATRPALLLIALLLWSPIHETFGQDIVGECTPSRGSKFENSLSSNLRENGDLFVECKYIRKEEESLIGENISLTVTCPFEKPSLVHTGYSIEPHNITTLDSNSVFVTRSATSLSTNGQGKYTIRFLFRDDYSPPSEIKVNAICNDL